MVDREIKIVVDELKGLTQKVVRRLAVETHANLVAPPSEGGTPVDTGWARANWVPTIGKPFTGLSGQRPKKGQQTRAGQLAQNRLAVVASQYQLEQGPVFVSNNVPYISRLNDGHSEQASPGFVQRALTKALNDVLRSVRSP